MTELKRESEWENEGFKGWLGNVNNCIVLCAYITTTTTPTTTTTRAIGTTTTLKWTAHMGITDYVLWNDCTIYRIGKDGIDYKKGYTTIGYDTIGTRTISDIDAITRTSSSRSSQSSSSPSQRTSPIIKLN